MTKEELWIKLMKYNQENHRCELCDNIYVYVIGIQGTIKQVWLCKWCFLKEKNNDL